MMDSKAFVIGSLFACIGGGIAVYLCLTLYETPLTDWATEDIRWSNNWLWMSTLDYYGAAACVSAVALSTETQRLRGLLWTAGFMLLGSPVCCAYVAYRCFFFKSLALANESGRAAREEYQRVNRYSRAARDEKSAARL
jgi:hypothetical protein